MKKGLLTTLIAFLLLIPFRLPISILFIKFFKWLLSETTSEVLPHDVLATNIIVTKLVYNLALSATFLYNIEMLSRLKYGRKPRSKDDYSRPVGYKDDPFFWWIVPIGVLLLAFVIMDAINVNSIFFANK